VRNRYILFNKPYGVHCRFSGESPNLGDYISVPEVYPVGRLDRDSEGLLLLTDDGRVQHRLAEPKFAHPRTYFAQVDRIPDDDALRRLTEGVETQGYKTRPARVRLLSQEPDLPPRDPPIRFRKSVATAWIELTLIEGRNRQVRHMTAAVGHPTLRLVRMAIGDLTLDGLASGKWRDASPAELRYLQAGAGA
jgi:23S rRNA pseudouridine2457 synthase